MICLPKTKTLVAPLDRGITSATKNKPAFKMSDIVNKTGVPISVGHLLFTRSLAFEFDEFKFNFITNYCLSINDK